MTPETRISNDPPTASELVALFIDAGFGKQPQEERLARAIQGTSRWWTVRDAETRDLVAVARCLTDWARYAAVYDVVVSRRRQRQGIGTALMRTLVRDLVEADIPTIHLWPTEGMIPFYEGLGFKALSSEHPVMVVKKGQDR